MPLISGSRWLKSQKYCFTTYDIGLGCLFKVLWGNFMFKRLFFLFFYFDPLVLLFSFLFIIQISREFILVSDKSITPLEWPALFNSSNKKKFFFFLNLKLRLNQMSCWGHVVVATVVVAAPHKLVSTNQNHQRYHHHRKQRRSNFCFYFYTRISPKSYGYHQTL